jgi:hypothetical protein
MRPVLLCILLTLGGPLVAQPSAQLPAANAAVLAYVNKHLGKRVGTGQCWDLAAAALQAAGASWDGRYRFGRLVDPAAEAVLPGDIIQFEGVLVEHTEGSTRMQERMGHHTAIVYAVIAPDQVELAHQNFGPSGKRVGRTTLAFAHIVKGHYLIYRPVE